MKRREGRGSLGVERTGRARWNPRSHLELLAHGTRGIAVLGGGHWIVGAGYRPDCRTGRAASGAVAVTVSLDGDDLAPAALPVRGARLVDAVPNPGLLADSATGPDGVSYPRDEPVLEGYFDEVLAGARIGGEPMFAKRAR